MTFKVALLLLVAFMFLLGMGLRNAGLEQRKVLKWWLEAVPPTQDM